MNLENFVNTMGINVIQVIDQIQCDQNSKNKTFIDADKFINKDWYKRRLRREACAGHVNLTGMTLEEEKKFLEDYIQKKLLAKEKSLQNQHSIFRMLNEAKKTTGCTGTINDDKSTDPSIPTDIINTNERKTTSFKVPSLFNSPQFTSDRSRTSNLPIAQILHHVTDKDTVNKSKENDVIVQSNVWRRPKTIKWCTTKEFLSRKIKTYKNACDIVSRHDGVIVRSSKQHHFCPNEEVEYISFKPCDHEIAFILPLIL